MNELNALTGELGLATQYHKDLPMDQRDQAFRDWRDGKVPFMIVTSDFGQSPFRFTSLGK